MTPKQILRSATAEAHERVDALFSTFNLSSYDGYRAFLTAQAAPLLTTEAELEDADILRLVSDWPDRKRGHLLSEDLSDLGHRSRHSGEAANSRTFRPYPSHTGFSDGKNNSALLGALYVLEGSRLGGSVLKRRIPSDAPMRFLTAPQPPGAWRKLLEKLDAFLYEPHRLDAAVGAARQVFQRFEHGAKRVLETLAQ